LKLKEIGFEKYVAGANPSPVLAVSYMKLMIASIPDGLIRNSEKELLSKFLGNNPKVNPETRIYVRTVLSLDPIRWSILRKLCIIASGVLAKATPDHIEPINLARVTTVTAPFEAASFSSPEQMRELNFKLDSWNKVWGFIMLHHNHLLY
jgi:hypothetical protein